MPFTSAAQRRFMYSQHPDIAKRWTAKYGSKIKPKKKSKEGFLSMFTTKQESLDQKASKIRKAIYDELRPPPQPVSDTYGYVRDVYEDHVIYCEGEHDWKVPFTVDAEGDIEAAPRDEWTEVEQTWTEVKAMREFIVHLKAKGKRGAKAPLGQGGRFAALEAKIASRGKVSNPAAVAAAIGRNKYGAGRMAKLSAQGRKHKEITLKFNRLHDKLGHFAKKVGGALKPSAAHRARKAAVVAAIKKGVAGTPGAIKKAGRWFLLGSSDKRGVPKLAMGRAILGGARAVGKVRTGVKRGIGKAVGQVGRVSRHEGPLGKPLKKVLGKVVMHEGPLAPRKVKRIVKRTVRTAGRNIKRSAQQKYGSTYNFLKGLGKRRRKEFQIPMTSFVFKGADDSYRWVLLSSNGFRDKDGEIVSTKALQQDVAQWELAGSPAQPLRFWHVPLTEDYSRGLEIGSCDFRMVNGHTLIESGTFLTKEIGEAVYNAQDKLAASLGFRHSPFEPDSDKIFNTIRTFERSLLPKESASNALTYLAAFTPQGV